MTHSCEIKWILQKSKPFIIPLVLSVVSIFFGTLLMLANPLFMKWLIDVVLPQRNVKLLTVATIALLLIYSGYVSLDGFGRRLIFRTSQKMIFNVRLGLFRHLQRLSAEYHDNKPVGDTLYRLEQDVDVVGMLLSEVVLTSLRIILMFSITILTLCSLNLRLALLILPFLSAFVLVQRYFRNKLQRCSETVQSQSGRLSSFLQEHLAGILQVQLLSRELTDARRFTKLAGKVTRSQIERNWTELLFTLATTLIIGTGNVSIIGFGAYQVIIGSLSIGGLVAFYSYTMFLFGPLASFIDVYSKVQRIRASIRRVLEIENATPAILDRQGALAIGTKIHRGIAFESVSFAYRSDRRVLLNTTLKVNSGERIALVGASGSGKSTIAKLIGRLYDAQDGAVLLGDHNVRDVQLKSLRSVISLIPQDPILFDGTLRENILYGNPKASEAEIAEAAAMAQLTRLVEQLPMGWEEMIGSRGNKLSGGERQRVALARGILQLPQILVLDEITSALDGLTEERLLESLKQFARNRTVIIISHRLSTILWANRVLVLDAGQIVGDGTPTSLFRRNRIFRGLLNEQLQREQQLTTGNQDTTGIRAAHLVAG